MCVVGGDCDSLTKQEIGDQIMPEQFLKMLNSEELG